MRQLQGAIILETNFIHIYVLKYIFLSSNILSISLYIIAWTIINLNKSNVLTTTESINRTLKYVEKIILKIWVQYVPSSVKVGSFLLRNPNVKSNHLYEHTGKDLTWIGIVSRPWLLRTTDARSVPNVFKYNTNSSLAYLIFNVMWR
jgi:hypothetical protein